MDFDTTVKLAIYQTIAESAKTPTSFDVATALGADEADVRDAFLRLHQKRLLVPEPDDSSRLRMAPPFSGVPTPFPVQVGEKRYFANCIWDAFGVAAALHADADIPAADGHAGEQITLRVRDGQPVPEPCVAHFAVPAALWWKNIIYT
jgi:hypothetical protein